MKNFKFSHAIYACSVLLLLTACGGGSGEEKVDDVNETITLQAGFEYQLSSPVDQKYTAEVTGSSSNVNVRWVGSSDCSANAETVREYVKTCQLRKDGSFVIQNTNSGSVTFLVRLKPVD